MAQTTDDYVASTEEEEKEQQQKKDNNGPNKPKQKKNKKENGDKSGDKGAGNKSSSGDSGTSGSGKGNSGSSGSNTGGSSNNSSTSGSSPTQGSSSTSGSTQTPGGTKAPGAKPTPGGTPTPSPTPPPVAEGGAATGGGATAGSTAAGSSAAAGSAAAAGGSAAGGAAAGGAAAGGGLFAALAGAWPIILTVVVIVLIIVLVIGTLGFVIYAPSLVLGKLKKMVGGFFQHLQGFFVGMDDAYVTDEQLVDTAQYLYDMGYDLVGMGFATSVEKDPDDEDKITKVKSDVLQDYLAAENRTYMISNDNFSLADVGTTITNPDKWLDSPGKYFGTGMLYIDSGIMSDIWHNIENTIADFSVGPLGSVVMSNTIKAKLVDDISINREAKTLKVSRLDTNLSWRAPVQLDQTWYNLEGWSGRYGKPFELLLTLHVATMAPDFVQKIANHPALDAKVTIKSEDRTFITNGMEISLTGADGDTTRTIKSKSEIAAMKNETTENGETRFPGAVIDRLLTIWDEASDIKTKDLYITKVEHHWFRNVYFEANNVEVGLTEDDSNNTDEESDNEKVDQRTGEKKSIKYLYTENEDGSKNLQIEKRDVHAYDMSGNNQVECEFDYSGGLPSGVSSIKITGYRKDGITQVEDGVRGKTNQYTKDLFKDKYYIYDGTEETAKKIQNKEIEPRELVFDKASLNAFSILEQMDTLDSQLIYRDLKELVIELGYYEREDFEQIERECMEWTIPDYIPNEWPEKKWEKQFISYGTLIRSKKSVDELKEKEAEELKAAEESQGEPEELLEGDATEQNQQSNQTTSRDTDSNESRSNENSEDNNTSTTTTISADAKKEAADGDGYTTTITVNGITYKNYKQYIGSYSGSPYWGGTISNSGCGPTSCAIILSGYGIDMLPLEVISTAGLTMTSIATMEQALNSCGVPSKGKMISSRDTAVSEIREAVSQGKPILISVDGQGRYSPGSHIMTILGINRDGKVIIGNPGRGDQNENGNTCASLEELVSSYMTYYVIPEQAPTGVVMGAASYETVGYEPGLDVIAMIESKVIGVLDQENAYTVGLEEGVNIQGKGLELEITSEKQIKGYKLVIFGFELDESITEGQTLKADDVIGKTTEGDICLILINDDRSIIENIEDYIKVPEPAGKGIYTVMMGSGSGQPLSNVATKDNYDITDPSYFVTNTEQFKSMFSNYPKIADNAKAFIDMQSKYGVNAVFAASVTIIESSAGTNWSAIPEWTHNWFSITGSYNGKTYRNPNSSNFRTWRVYPSYAEAVDDFGDLISKGSYYIKAGKKTVAEIAIPYCNAEWGNSVNKYMSQAYAKINGGN